MNVVLYTRDMEPITTSELSHVLLDVLARGLEGL